MKPTVSSRHASQPRAPQNARNAQTSSRGRVIAVVPLHKGYKAYNEYMDEYFEEEYYYEEEEEEEEEDEGMCPLCVEELDETEKNFWPCTCGYQLCLFCYERVKSECKSQCPGCRQPYGDPVSADQVIKKPREKDARPKKTRPAPSAQGPHTPPRPSVLSGSQWQGSQASHSMPPPPAWGGHHPHDDHQEHSRYPQPPPHPTAAALAGQSYAVHHQQQQQQQQQQGGRGWGLGNASWASQAAARGGGAAPPAPGPVPAAPQRPPVVVAAPARPAPASGVVSAEDFPSLADAVGASTPQPVAVASRARPPAPPAGRGAPSASDSYGSDPMSHAHAQSRVPPLAEAGGMLTTLQGSVRDGRVSSQEAADKLCALLRPRQHEMVAPVQAKLRQVHELAEQVSQQQAAYRLVQQQAALRQQQAAAEGAASAAGGRRPPPGFEAASAAAAAAAAQQQQQQQQLQQQQQQQQLHQLQQQQGSGMLGGSSLLLGSGGSSLLGGGQSLLGLLQSQTLFGAAATGSNGALGGGLGSLETLQALFSGSGSAQPGLLGQLGVGHHQQLGMSMHGGQPDASAAAFGAATGGAHRPLYARGSSGVGGQAMPPMDASQQNSQRTASLFGTLSSQLDTLKLSGGLQWGA